MRYSENDDRIIREMRGARATQGEIADRLNRTEQSIKCRCKLLGLTVAPKGFWTPERDAVLRDLRAKKFSYGVIAIELGGGATRNACISRGMRIGIPQTQRVARVVAKKERNIAWSTKPRAPTLHVEQPAPQGFLGITFGELQDHHCRFPRGEGPFLFCGQPAIEGSSYCADCHRITHDRVSTQEANRRPVQAAQARTA
jgi:hypothetical protein